MGHVRTSRDRWATMAGLLIAFERAIEGVSRLDAYDPIEQRRHARDQAADHQHLLRFSARVRRLEDRIDYEVDRLTAELLTAQLATKRSVELGEIIA